MSASGEDHRSWAGWSPALFALGSLLSQGYRYGVADHRLHLPMASEAIGHPLPAGDLLAGAAALHPTLWWPLLGHLGPGGALTLHVALLVATGAALLRLGRRTVGAAAPWAVLLLIVGQSAWGGVDTADSLLLPRGAAWPAELLAWSWFLEGRRGRAFALLGACACLHAPSAAALGGALALVHIIERRPWLPLLGMAAAAAPVALPYLLGHGATLHLGAAHRAVIDLRLGHHVDVGTWAPAQLLGGGIWSVILAMAWPRLDPELRRSAVALLVVAALGGLGWGLRLALPVQLELWQAGRFLAVAGCLGAATLLGASRRGLGELAGGLLSVGLLLPGTLALAVADRWGRGGRREPEPSPLVAPPRAPSFAFALLLAVALAVGARHPPSGRSPARWSLHPPDADLSWVAAALPPGALLATPPSGFGGLRLRGLGLYGTWKDGGEALFDAGRAAEWRRRMTLLSGAEALAPLGRSRARGERQLRLRRRLERGFEAQDPDELAARLAGEGVGYLLWSGAAPRGVEVLARRGGMSLLRLAGTAPIMPR